MGAIDRVFRSRRPSQERPLAAIIAGLWKNNEQGVWYDSSDLSTMYQDLAGTTPVYMPGQGQPDPWIGLQLDKRLGLVRGQERLTNGDFTSTAGWVESGVGVALSAAAGELQITSASPLGAYQQPNNFVVGRWYVVTGQIRVGSAASVTIRTVAGGSSLGTMVAESQVVTSSAFVVVSYIFQATNTANAIYLRVGTTNSTAFFKSLSVRELPGNHRWQGTATSRAVLSARYNLLTATEDLRTTVWQKSNSTAPTSSRLVETTAASTHYVSQPYTAASGTPVRFSVRAKPAGRSWIRLTLSLASGGDASSYFDLSTGSKGALGGGSATITPVGDGSYICTVAGTISSSNPSCGVLLASDNNAQNYTGDGTSGVDVLWSDLRGATDGIGLPPYQRVDDASTYDTAGFPLYRKPDGVDDWMQTAAVDFSGTDKVIVATAMRKLSDAARAILIELGTAAENIAGNFAVEAPSAGLQNFAARGSGSSSVNTVQTASAIAPLSAVLLARIDSAAGVGLRINGGAWAENKTPFGGNFVNAPVYFDRRSGASLPSSARDYGTLIVGRLLTGLETAAVEKFLRQKSRAY